MSKIVTILETLKKTKSPWIIRHKTRGIILVEVIIQDIIVWVVNEPSAKIYITDIIEVLDKDKYPEYLL